MNFISVGWIYTLKYTPNQFKEYLTLIVCNILRFQLVAAILQSLDLKIECWK